MRESKKFILFPNSAEIERTEAEMKQVQVVSDILQEIDIEQKQNDELVQSMTDLFNVVKCESWKLGFAAALKLTQDNEEMEALKRVCDELVDKLVEHYKGIVDICGEDDDVNAIPVNNMLEQAKIIQNYINEKVGE